MSLAPPARPPPSARSPAPGSALGPALATSIGASMGAGLARLRHAGDALFALAVLAVVILLVAPVPPALLDAGQALSLALAATLLTVTLLARDALAFASFPALLLLTTLLRLALSVAATRLVLTRGEAGRVIEAFGRVAVGGSPVAGAVVFAILTLVQLLVVAKGAERVAEVAARFTLDALPGKQLAIDADLRAGLVDAGAAAARRRALERESQLYGAMDGALKFVKGDAIAGVAIVLVNALGGLAAGALRGQALGAAARRAVLLAVGDGLASQLPALLVAVAAGVAVTRVGAERSGDRLGGEVGRQLLAEPRALAVVAGLLGALALAPGLPAVPFLVLGAAAGGLAWRARGWSADRAPAWRGAAHQGREGPDAPDAGPITAVPPEAPPVILELSEPLLALATEAGSTFLGATLPALGERLWRDLGLPPPPIAVRGAPLPAGGWALLVHEVPAARGLAAPDARLALAPVEDLALTGIAFVHSAERGPGRPAAVIDAADEGRAAVLGPVLGPLERVVEACALVLERQAPLLLGLQEAQALLDGLEPSAPALVREATRQLPPALLAEVLRRLLEEGVAIRPLGPVLEALLEAGGAPRGAAALAAAARRALRRHIAHRAEIAGALPALLLDPAAEQEVRESLLGELPALEPARAALLLEALDAALAAAVDGAGGPPVLLASGDVRRAVRLLVAARHPALRVLAYDELPVDQAVRPLGRLALAA
jgi:type III secretion protein V